ncbi:MAG: SGNH/GDSL hydrolase family protein [Deltaproteobacteria bacterium]|nr:SGNH/GDSL hydrolase family protein [Deltaproteobacteria bacterium]
MKGKILANIALVVVSIIFTFLLLELVVFRFVLIAPDMPKLYFADGIVKYIPNQKGIYRVQNEIKSKFNINANGWNSYHSIYNKEKILNKYRIAIIGDSYVEALQVDFDSSLAEQLEKYLGIENSEVFRFGISGAPMSQYLHLLRNEVGKYRPDLVIILLAHNDFNESYDYAPGVYTSSFLKIKIDNGMGISEISPIKLQTQWYSFIRDYSATWRYLAYRQQVKFNVLRNIIFNKQEKKEAYRANIPISCIKSNTNKNKLLTDYIFREMKHYTDNIGSDLIIAIDGDRQAIYSNQNTEQLYEAGVLNLNLIAKSSAKENNIHFIDLHPIFEEAFHKNAKRFEFQCDGHWNAYAHQIVANAIYQYVQNKNIVTSHKSVLNTGKTKSGDTLPVFRENDAELLCWYNSPHYFNTSAKGELNDSKIK